MDLTDLESLRAQIDEFLWPDEDARQRAKRRRILLAATDLFVRLGYRRTSVDEIARKAGVAKGTVYLYYRNKAEIVYHAIALEKRAHLERLTGPFVDATLSPLERLQGFIAIALIMSRELPLTASLTQGDHEFELAVQEMDESVVRNANERQLLVLFELLDAATGGTWSRERLEQRGRLLIDLLLALATSNRLNTGSMSWDEYAHAMAEIIVNGLTNPGEAIPELLLATSAHPSPESERANA
jgi:AcrR family transcriptional regulator